MKIGSISEDLNLEKRISLTPELSKKYLDLGVEIFINNSLIGKTSSVGYLKTKVKYDEEYTIKTNKPKYEPVSIMTLITNSKTSIELQVNQLREYKKEHPTI